MSKTKVHVELGARSYDIHIGAGLLNQAGSLIAPLLARPHTAIVTDSNLAKTHLASLQATLKEHGITAREIVVPAGEASKSFHHLADICDQLLAADIERRDVVIALGGGVIGDLTGFAAAILRRGVNFVQIPTSLLAQVDSSVGGKTGINAALGKNLIGAFHQPLMVIADSALLATLPEREFSAGYAEVAKYGLLGDEGFFTWLEKNITALFKGDDAMRIEAIRRSCEAKAAIVARDEREGGVRALLNLGHTFGHALEQATGYSTRLLHGEGVAIGMAMAVRFSEFLHLCPKGTHIRVEEHLKVARLPTQLCDISGQLPEAAEFIEIMRQDKKAEGGRLTFILMRNIGDTFIDKGVDEAGLKTFLQQELSRS